MWALSFRKAAPWRNSLFRKFGNGMLYRCAFTAEAPIQNFQSVWGSILGQIHIHIDENQPRYIHSHVTLSGYLPTLKSVPIVWRHLHVMNTFTKRFPWAKNQFCTPRHRSTHFLEDGREYPYSNSINRYLGQFSNCLQPQLHLVYKKEKKRKWKAKHQILFCYF